MLRAYTAPRTAQVAAAMMDGFLSKLGDEIAGQPPGIFDRQPQAVFLQPASLRHHKLAQKTAHFFSCKFPSEILP